MKIHIDFDDRLFDEPTWDALYLNAKALRHIMRGLVDLVELYSKRELVDGERRRCIVLRIDLLIGSRIVSHSIEFSLDGYWRAYDYGAGELPPFQRYNPQSQLAYERDLINRPELRMDIIYDAMRAWLVQLAAQEPSSTALREAAGKLGNSIELSKRIKWG